MGMMKKIWSERGEDYDLSEPKKKPKPKPKPEKDEPVPMSIKYLGDNGRAWLDDEPWRKW